MKNSFNLKITAPNHIRIYTDGSKNGNKVSCTAIQHNTKIIKQLPNSTSIYSAEAKAIDLALNIIIQTESPNSSFFFFLTIGPNIPKKKTKTWIIP